ncbi:sialidase family protein [Novipirellula artificiosorum]|uniref:exo-alpha-sialidase n=1 Tax=Novipirellula artificiosorum TaxID=2528016 RepID=A0A5C6DWA0_9BACT|nr:exo-alpha-sialidase [Novipirellula artificiosorum]TWU39681.1 BNR/Asp-box repeat protein [Novipirellula artificiosorum]
MFRSLLSLTLFFITWPITASHAVDVENKFQETDWRNLANAVAVIPDEGYCDQPYLVVNQEGDWVCVMTTGAGDEGERGQHIVSTISTDNGRTWSPLADIEPADGPEASWVVPVISQSGRIYAIYTYNFDDLRQVKDYTGKLIDRVDTMGKLMMKYSDDGGRTWSSERYEVPMRNFKIDENNIYGGERQFFWSISKPITIGNDLFMGMGKVGNFGKGFMHTSEGCVLKSPNLMTETDPKEIIWETLPEGDMGIAAPALDGIPGGEVADEHNVVPLRDGSLFLTFRTVAGYAGQAYSRDGGKTWETKPLEFNPGGRIIKQPRCLNKVYRFRNGKYALFFHNNSTTSYGGVVRGNRNPTWICGGVEKDGSIHWSQPEVFLYDTKYFHGISYPDWLEHDGRYFISETQKQIARIHEVPADFLESLWNRALRSEVAEEGMVKSYGPDKLATGASVGIPWLNQISAGDGFAIELSFTAGDLTQRQVIFDSRLRNRPPPAHGARLHRGQGIEIAVLPDGQIEVILDDVAGQVVHQSGNRVIKPGVRSHVVLNVDAGSKVLSLVVDGELLDGGKKPYGFVRLSPYFNEVNGETEFTIPEDVEFHRLRFYNRHLSTTEAIGNYRAGSI